MKKEGKMEPNQKALQLIKRFEGFSPDAYLCPGGKWTVGYGHTESVNPGMRISEEEAEKLLPADIAKIESAIQPLLKVALTENQYCAILSLVFNIGVRAFERSTLLRKINSGDIEGAAGEFLRWSFVKWQYSLGLRRRREIEMEMFLSGASEFKIISEYFL